MKITIALTKEQLVTQTRCYCHHIERERYDDYRNHDYGCWVGDAFKGLEVACRAQQKPA